VRKDPNVGLHRQRKTDTYRVPVYRGDHGFSNSESRRIHTGVRTERGVLLLLEHFCACGKIRPHAEVVARTREHDGPHVIVSIAFGVRGSKVRTHRAGERVARIWPIEGKNRNARIQFEGDVRIIQSGSLQRPTVTVRARKTNERAAAERARIAEFVLHLYTRALYD